MSRRLRSLSLLCFATALAMVPNGASPLSANAFGMFREDDRINQLTMQFGTDSFATKNALGGAIVGLAQTNLQSAINSNVQSGAISLLFEMPGLVDLSGANESSLQVGVLNGSPLNPGSPYNGNSDLDWWYSPNATDLNGSGVPTHQLSGSITSHALSISGPYVHFVFTLGDVIVSSVQIAATTGAVSTPLTSSDYSPPGHPASDQIDPSLQSFGSMSSGQMKGNVSAASLAAAPIPSAFTGSGCNGVYTSANTLLDVLVTGCVDLIIQLVKPTQPDQVDPNAPVAGAGGPYHLIANSAHSVNACNDKNGTAVNLATCLNAAAYSSYFKFTADRVIGKAPQYITFTSTPPANPLGGGTYQATATGGPSTSSVVFSLDPASTAGACTVSTGGLLNFTGAGTCTVDANQAGAANFFAAEQVSQSIVITTAISGITPNAVGQGAKNLAVTISGSGFASGDTPSISGAGAALSSVVVVDASTITARLTLTMSAATGARDVLLVTSSGTAICGGCLTIDPHPAPTSLGPGMLQTGAASVSVTINGAGFEPGASKVTITGPSNGVKAKSVTFVSSTQLTAKISVASTAALGAYNVKVTNPDAGVGTCAGCFTVTQGPILSSIAPNSASRGQKVSVTLTGQFFSTGSAVKGPSGVTFASVVVVNSTTITAMMTVSSTAPTGTNLVVTMISPAAAGSGRGSCACLSIT